jgi:hypothetical protein
MSNWGRSRSIGLWAGGSATRRQSSRRIHKGTWLFGTQANEAVGVYVLYNRQSLSVGTSRVLGCITVTEAPQPGMSTQPCSVDTQVPPSPQSLSKRQSTGLYRYADPDRRDSGNISSQNIRGFIFPTGGLARGISPVRNDTGIAFAVAVAVFGVLVSMHTPVSGGASRSFRAVPGLVFAEVPTGNRSRGAFSARGGNALAVTGLGTPGHAQSAVRLHVTAIAVISP